ncbi:hypothetical protein JTB14_015237 [Gonioctena quinquepunctata]|nr:hypothetical protein JTB14_015237 [Gonioctena quinquepunctata]
MGRKFAMVELKSVLSKFLRNYEVLPATPPQPLVLMAEVVLVSKTGAQISIKKRGVELNGNIKGNAD